MTCLPSFNFYGISYKRVGWDEAKLCLIAWITGSLLRFNPAYPLQKNLSRPILSR